jgi:hypothetical protein
VKPRHWLTALLLVGAAAAMVAPTFQFPSRWADPYDWRYFEASEEVARTTVADYHEPPLWNPYMCGGEVMLANPQSTAASPTFIFSVLFGTALGLKLSLFVLLLAALHGGYLLGRQLALSYPAALLVGISYGTCGWFAMHLSSGHINFAGAALYPYLLYGYRRAVAGTWTWSILSAAAVAWMIGLGGTYTAPMGAVLLATIAVTDAIAERRMRPLTIAFAIGAAAFVLSAARLLPVLEFAHDHPRHVPEKDANNAFDLLRAFFAWRNILEPVGGNHVYWWHEYCCKLPYLTSVLAVLGLLGWKKEKLLTAKDVLREWLPAALIIGWTAFTLVLPRVDYELGRRIGYRDSYHLAALLVLWWTTRHTPPAARRFLPVVVIAIGIAVGGAWPHGPWFLIRHLPIYADLRVPSRYLIVAALPVCIWAGMGLDRLLAWIGQKKPSLRLPWIAGLATVAVLVEGLLLAVPTYRNVFTIIQRPSVKRPPFYQVDGDIRWMITGILEGRGTLKCDEEAPLQRGELDRGLPQDGIEQVRLVDPAAGKVTQKSWSPNKIEVEVDVARGSDVLINQNWNEHWIASGAIVKPIAGRLAFSVESGKHLVTLRYRPRSFVTGTYLSLAGLALAPLVILLGIRRRRRPLV